MNQNKKQEKTKFSRLRLRSTASTSKKSVSPFVNPREKISSYFSSQLDETYSKSQELFTSGSESQYGQKFSSNEKVENGANDDEDFDEKKSIKPAKVFEIKVEKESRLTRKRTRNKNDLTRFVKDMGPSCSDTNQEHLHLALAMSKSLEELENPGESQEDSPFPSTQQKIATLKSTLDQFGFKSDRTAVEIPTLRNNTRQRKKLKFITPTLFLRTDEDRAKLIETKVSGILTNISVYNKFLEENESQNNNKEEKFINNKPNSFLLRDYYDEESTIFKINNLSLSEINDSTFYNKTVPKEVVKTGILLKNWHSIPGREKTPPLSEVNIIVDETERTLEKEEKGTSRKNSLIFQEIVEETEKSPENCEKEKSTHRKNSYLTSEENIVEETEVTPINYKEKSVFPRKTPISKENIIVEETEEIQHESSEERTPEKNTENVLCTNPINYEENIADQRKTSIPKVNILFEETEEIQHENSEERTPEKTTGNVLCTNTPTDRSISPDLFSDCELELGINPSPNDKTPNHFEKSPCNNPNLHTPPSFIHSLNKNNERSPIIVLSSSNSNKIENSPVLSEKEIFSDDSDSKSLSLLDSISPRRNKNRSPEKKLRNTKSPRKSLFIGPKADTVEDILQQNTAISNSPIKTFENYSQICHFESFHDNSNDCFDLTRSSEGSNDIFNADTILNPTKHFEDVPISENLFSETVNEIGGHDDNYSIDKQKEISRLKETEEFIDLTQSSNDAVNNKKIEDTNDKNNFEQKYKKHFEETILFHKNKPSSKYNDTSDTDANNSVQTLLLKNNFFSKNITEIEEKNTVSLKRIQEDDSNDSVKTVLLMKNTSPKNTKQNIDFPKNVKDIPEQNKIVNGANNCDNDYSPEFDILNSSNNKDFYNSLNNTSLSVISDSESENENKSHRDISKTFYKSLKSQKNSTSPKKKSLSVTKSPNKNTTTPKNINTTLKRSFSENIIDDKELNFVSQVADKTNFFKLSSPLSVTNFFTQPCLIRNHELLTKDSMKENFEQSLDDIDISDEELNYSVLKSKKPKSNRNRNVNDISDSDEEINKSVNKSKIKATGSKNNLEYNDVNDQFLSQSSVGTCSDISDEELNYSTNKSFRKKRLSEEIDDNIEENFGQVGNFIDFNDLPYTGLEPPRTSLNINETLNKTKPSEILKHPRVQDLQTPIKVRSEPDLAPNDTFNVVLKQTSTPNHNENNVKTPENTKTVPINITPNNDYIIKTTDVTPMPNYNEMSSPQLRKELDKYGIRPLKRAKGIKILQYIYEATHPILEQNLEKTVKSSSDEEDDRIIKRRKKNTSSRKSFQNRLTGHNEKTAVECIGNEIANCEKEEDMIFERKQSVRIASCRLPLHIAWHNLVSSNQELHEKILLYEPIQVEEIYAKLKSFGYKFHIQDIITFLDKKCVTIRVAQNKKKAAGS